MKRPMFRKVLGVAGAIALITAVVAAGPAATARRTSPLRFVGTTRDLRAIAAQDKHRQPGGGSDAVDADYLRTHQFEGTEPEGGEAVRHGEVAAPTATGNARSPAAASAWARRGKARTTSTPATPATATSSRVSRRTRACAPSDTHVFEIINSVVQVYTPTGTALLDGDPFFPGTEPVGITLAQFFGLPPEFVRPDGPFGPTSFDVSCQYDASTQRWFVSAEYRRPGPDDGRLHRRRRLPHRRRAPRPTRWGPGTSGTCATPRTTA